jgi:FkbM family methyltransferase
VKPLFKIKQHLLGHRAKRRVSYAESGEDLLLWHLLRHGFKLEKGIYVDVGAYDPHQKSNTFIFYLAGWHGLNIDPLPGGMARFRQHRPRDINLELAITPTARQYRYYQFATAMGRAMNTLDEAQAERQSQGRHQRVETVSVAGQPLAAVLASYLPASAPFGLLKVDVEGLEEAVLQSNDWTRFRPYVVMVEDFTDLMALDAAHPIIALLQAEGYQPVAKTMKNLIFKLQEA